MHVLYLGVLYGTARAALVRKRSYLGLSDEKTTVPFLPFIPFRSVPFRVLVLPKNFLPKIKKDLMMTCHIRQPLEKAKNKEDAINQPQSHPIEKCRI